VVLMLASDFLLFLYTLINSFWSLIVEMVASKQQLPFKFPDTENATSFIEVNPNSGAGILFT